MSERLMKVMSSLRVIEDSALRMHDGLESGADKADFGYVAKQAGFVLSHVQKVMDEMIEVIEILRGVAAAMR